MIHSRYAISIPYVNHDVSYNPLFHTGSFADAIASVRILSPSIDLYILESII